MSAPVSPPLSVERGQVLRHLREKQVAAQRLSASPEAAEIMHDRTRQLGVLIDEIMAGLHVEEADHGEA